MKLLTVAVGIVLCVANISQAQGPATHPADGSNYPERWGHRR